VDALKRLPKQKKHGMLDGVKPERLDPMPWGGSAEDAYFAFSAKLDRLLRPTRAVTNSPNAARRTRSEWQRTSQWVAGLRLLTSKTSNGPSSSLIVAWTPRWAGARSTCTNTSLSRNIARRFSQRSAAIAVASAPRPNCAMTSATTPRPATTSTTSCGNSNARVAFSAAHTKASRGPGEQRVAIPSIRHLPAFENYERKPLGVWGTRRHMELGRFFDDTNLRVHTLNKYTHTHPTTTGSFLEKIGW
jgi:hypothetical protein